MGGLLAIVLGVSTSLGQTLGTPVEPVRYQQVSIGGPFWGPRLKVLREATLAANRHQCDATGRFSNFDKAAKKIKGEAAPGEFEGLLFNDSDVYKVLEGWSYAVANEPDAAKKISLDAELDAMIARVAAAQHSDGYIDTYYTLKAGVDKRLTREEWDHETYCMGHLIEAGVAHYQATGKRTLLGVAVKAADFLDRLYTQQGFAMPSGHEEVELALVRLSDALGDQKYADLAFKLVELRGRTHKALDGKEQGPWGDYAQDHKPAAEQTEVAGHAVRAGYLYCAMADLARLGRSGYKPALDNLWEDVTRRRIFVTGGIGPSGKNEGFTVPYDIPTRSAYQETCASIALCMWAHRMYLLEGDPRYMEQFERTLYNAALAGVSLDGERFFYVNPLESRRGDGRRAWYPCACCPPNVLRFFGELGQYIYAVRGDRVYVNLLMESKAALTVEGQPVEIEQTTGYPFDARVTVSVKNNTDKPVLVGLRSGRGALKEGGPDDGYAWITVPEHQGARVDWNEPVEAKRIYADGRVKAAAGRVALERGPLVYAAEGIDNGGDVTNLILPVGSSVAESKDADGTPVLVCDGLRASGDGGEGSPALYSSGRSLTRAKITLRPYFMWSNRGTTSMSVWIPETAQALGPAAMAGVKASASFVGHGDGLVALSDRVLPESSGDEGVPRLTFWPHKGRSGESSEETLTYEFAQARRVSGVGVYWFDDSGHGECRVPAGCELEYLDGKVWKPVPGASVGIEKDAMNRSAFAPLATRGLRLRVRLREGASAGVLEWAVSE